MMEAMISMETANKMITLKKMNQSTLRVMTASQAPVPLIGSLHPQGVAAKWQKDLLVAVW